MRLFSILLNSIPQINQGQLDLGIVDPIISKLSACIRAAFFLSHGIRTDTTMYILVEHENCVIKLVGSELKYLWPDVRSIALLLMKAQMELKLNKGKSSLSKRGVYINKGSLNLIETLREININSAQVIFPSLNGKSIEEIMIGVSVSFIVPVEYPPSEFIVTQLVNQGFKEVFFREIYTIDNFIVMAHNHLDVLRGNDSDGDN